MCSWAYYGTKMVKSLLKHNNSRIAIWLDVMDGEKWLTLHWYCFSRWHSGCIAFSSFYQDGQSSLMNVCNQLSLRLPRMQDQELLTLQWCALAEWGRERVSDSFKHKGNQSIQKQQWCITVSIFQSWAGYLNATINRKSRNVQLEIGTDWTS